MHNPGKGISRSALPYRRSVPTWQKLTSQDVEEQIVKLARKGLRPSQIGVILRDSHGVAQVRRITGNKIVRILRSKVIFNHLSFNFLFQGMAPEIPEDLYHLIKKAVSIRKHLERFRKDIDSKFVLLMIALFFSNFQVSSDFGRVQNPSLGSLLQDQTYASTNMEI